MKTTFLALVASLALAACGAAQTPSPTAVPQPATSQPPATSTATPSKGSSTAGPSIVYTRSGGIAGATVQWTIYPDGRVVTDKGEERRIDPAKAADAFSRIEQLNFFGLGDVSARGPGCPDCFKYTVTVTMGGRTSSITTFDAAPNTPAAVAQVLELVSSLVTGR